MVPFWVETEARYRQKFPALLPCHSFSYVKWPKQSEKTLIFPMEQKIR